MLFTLTGVNYVFYVYFVAPARPLVCRLCARFKQSLWKLSYIFNSKVIIMCYVHRVPLIRSAIFGIAIHFACMSSVFSSLCALCIVGKYVLILIIMYNYVAGIYSNPGSYVYQNDCAPSYLVS